MRVRGDNGLIFEVEDSVATSMADAGYVTLVTSHIATPPVDEEPPAPPVDEEPPNPVEDDSPKPARGRRAK